MRRSHRRGRAAAVAGRSTRGCRRRGGRGEQGGRRAACDRTRLRRADLAQHAEQLQPQLLGALEPILGFGCGGAHQQPVERVVLGEQRHVLRCGQAVDELALIAAELEHQHRERAGDRVHVARDRRALRRHLGRLEPDGAVDRRDVVVDAAHPAEVDQLDAVADLDDVGRLEVAVQQAEAVQVREGGQHLDHVGERLVDGDRREAAAVVLHPALQQVVERLPADVLHDDVRGPVGGGDEVVDLDDDRVLDLGEELLLGHRGTERVGVAGVEQTLHHDPPVVHVAVAGEVDPAHAAVCEAADDLVLTAEQGARGELRIEVERGAALRAETLRASGRAVAGPTHR
jgi:hypothetical protein